MHGSPIPSSPRCGAESTRAGRLRRHRMSLASSPAPDVLHLLEGRQNIRPWCNSGEGASLSHSYACTRCVLIAKVEGFCSCYVPTALPQEDGGETGRLSGGICFVVC